MVAKLHNHNYIHGDLTTSNFMIEDGTGDLVLLDFGLTTVSSSAEDMGVDLYVLERAFLSLHDPAAELVLLVCGSEVVRRGDARLRVSGGSQRAEREFV